MILDLISRIAKHNASPKILGLIAAMVALRCLWLWQPERQVLLHQRHLLDAAERRDWSRFASFIDQQYSDRWQHDKTFLVRESSEVLRQFIALTIERDLINCSISSSQASVSMRLKLRGTGTPIAQYAASSVDGLSEPFLFVWKRGSWKPWDWKLASADQPELRLDRSLSF